MSNRRRERSRRSQKTLRKQRSGGSDQPPKLYPVLPGPSNRPIPSEARSLVVHGPPTPKSRHLQGTLIWLVDIHRNYRLGFQMERGLINLTPSLIPR